MRPGFKILAFLGTIIFSSAFILLALRPALLEDRPIDEQGIAIKSDFVDQQIPWEKIESHHITDKGIIIKSANAGNSYLSKRNLSDESWQYLLSKLN